MLEAQELTATIAKKHGGRDMIFAKNKEEAGEIWQARKGVHWSILALVPDGKAYSTGGYWEGGQRSSEGGSFAGVGRCLRAGVEAAAAL